MGSVVGSVTDGVMGSVVGSVTDGVMGSVTGNMIDSVTDIVISSVTGSVDQRGFRTGDSDRTRHFSNRCDINKVVKVVHGNWSDSHCNDRSDTQPSGLLLQLY